MAGPQDKSSLEAAIGEAIRLKRDGHTRDQAEWEAMAEDLLRDIDSFDLDLAERKLRSEERPVKPAGLIETGVVFPELAPEEAERPQSVPRPRGSSHQARGDSGVVARSGFLQELREQARERQQQQSQEAIERNQANELLDKRLRQVFLYLHELVQQLNILRPTLERSYEISPRVVMKDLVWQEGFADYRTQSQSSGALIEMVSFSFQVASPRRLSVQFDAAAADRFRKQIFDFGLRFRMNERHNQRRQLLFADFEIDSEFGVSARWRADYDAATIRLECRNLERLGNYTYRVDPACIDQELMDEFGHLVLGQSSRFPLLCRR